MISRERLASSSERITTSLQSRPPLARPPRHQAIEELQAEA